jgi:hypothetical protein
MATAQNNATSLNARLSRQYVTFSRAEFERVICGQGAHAHHPQKPIGKAVDAMALEQDLGRVVGTSQFCVMNHVFCPVSPDLMENR